MQEKMYQHKILNSKGLSNCIGISLTSLFNEKGNQEASNPMIKKKNGRIIFAFQADDENYVHRVYKALTDKSLKNGCFKSMTVIKVDEKSKNGHFTVALQIDEPAEVYRLLNEILGYDKLWSKEFKRLFALDTVADGITKLFKPNILFTTKISQPSHLDLLPDEIKLHILPYLNDKSLVRLMSASRYWLQFINKENPSLTLRFSRKTNLNWFYCGDSFLATRVVHVKNKNAFGLQMEERFKKVGLNIDHTDIAIVLNHNLYEEEGEKIVYDTMLIPLIAVKRALNPKPITKLTDADIAYYLEILEEKTGLKWKTISTVTDKSLATILDPNIVAIGLEQKYLCNLFKKMGLEIRHQDVSWSRRYLSVMGDKNAENQPLDEQNYVAYLPFEAFEKALAYSDHEFKLNKAPTV